MKKNFFKQLKEQKNAYLFILPALILFFVFFLYPLFSTFRYSFLDWARSVSPEGFKGIQNYINLFTKDTIFRVSLANNFKLVFVIVLSQITIPVFLALLLDAKLKARAFFRLIFFMPAIISTVIVAAIWKYIFYPNTGLISNFGRILHLDFLNYVWLADERIAIYIIALVMIWQLTGYNMVIYLANLQSIPEEITEAAIVDGANNWQVIRKIKIPLLRPSINIVTTIMTIAVFKLYELIVFITNGGPSHTTNVLTFYLIKRVTTGFHYSYACAIAVILTLIVVVLTIIINQVIFNKKYEMDY